MRVFILSDNMDFSKEIEHICFNLDYKMLISNVTEEEMIYRAISDREDVFIVDTSVSGKFKISLTEILLKMNSKLILIMDNIEKISDYLPLNVIDYYTKPVNWEKLTSTLELLYFKYKVLEADVNSKSLLIKNTNEVTILSYDDILFFEKNERTVIVHTHHKKFDFESNLKAIELKSPKYFIRSHNSYIINLDRISKIEEINSRLFSVVYKDYPLSANMSKAKLKDLFSDTFSENVDKLSK